MSAPPRPGECDCEPPEPEDGYPGFLCATHWQEKEDRWAAHRRACGLPIRETDEAGPIVVWVTLASTVESVDSCTARPWPSCSRADGQRLRHWDRSPRWTNEGMACS